MATLNIKNFPDELYDELRELAEAEHRSVAQQVLHLLQHALRASPPASIRELKGLGRANLEGLAPEAFIAAERDSWD